MKTTTSGITRIFKSMNKLFRRYANWVTGDIVLPQDKWKKNMLVIFYFGICFASLTTIYSAIQFSWIVFLLVTGKELAILPEWLGVLIAFPLYNCALRIMMLSIKKHI